MPTSHGAEFRELIEADEILVMPGAHDPMTAKAIEHAGFEGVYMTGYGTSLSRAGVPDAGLITMPEMVANANAVQESVDVPVLGDADNGYGNATNVVRTIREYVKTGAAGCHIEDQTFPKRCGHTKGRQVVSREEAVGKVRAAADTRDERDPEFVVVARTDARGAVGGDMDEAIDRANAFLEAGADVAFVEGPTDEAEVERVGEEVDGPLLYNLAGISPQLDADTLEEYGFDVVIYPSLGMQTTIAAVYKRAVQYREEGAAAFAEMEAEMAELPFDFHEFAGFPEVVAQEGAYLPEEEMDKYEGTLGADVGNE
jgi:2-methylisocitrate lyase-like PEP mutase family enzyme